ncbi:hypothetical protein FHS16_001317 [Paenibacillus endophyticus]|uniref:Uncharacterized protein n=1 Tax=Paenibacillus endophyticus TaxID=1294268 RepID=A0A7W5C5W1_9BACL|nr:hypothetical protein [Paenibacillus endophyticus]MBB3151274.1 hypothetical protein [Paenibacillus endophyticus]
MGEEMSGHSVIRNAICMSVLIFTIAAALSSYGVVPERVHASEEAERATYKQLESTMESVIGQLYDPSAATGSAADDYKQLAGPAIQLGAGPEPLSRPSSSPFD